MSRFVMITVLALFAAVLDLNANAGSTSEKNDQLVSDPSGKFIELQSRS